MKHLLLKIVLLALIVCGCQSKSTEQQTDAEGFVQIFDGQTLNNWDYDSVYWKVENGCIVGEVIPSTLLKYNSFIIWQGGEPENFELKMEYKITENGNSGVNYRSVRIDTIPFALRGYQCDIDGHNNYTGMNYEEKKRTTLAKRGQKVIVKPMDQNSSIKDFRKDNAWQNIEVSDTLGNADSLTKYFKNNDWNEIHLIVNGNRLQHFVNNVLMCDVTDNDSINRTTSGRIGVQVHVGPPMKVEYRNIRLKEIK